MHDFKILTTHHAPCSSSLQVASKLIWFHACSFTRRSWEKRIFYSCYLSESAACGFLNGAIISRHAFKQFTPKKEICVKPRVTARKICSIEFYFLFSLLLLFLLFYFSVFVF